MPDTDDDQDIREQLQNRPAPTDEDFARALADVRRAVDRQLGGGADLEARLENLEKQVAALLQGQSAMRSPLGQSVFLARVGEDDAWCEQAATGSGTNVTLTDFVDGRGSDNRFVIPAETAAGSNRVAAVLQMRSGAGGLQYFALPQGGQIVKLTSTSGGNGSATTRPTYVYTLDAVTFAGDGTPTTGAELATGKSPKFGRPKGEVEGPAEYGLAQPSNDGGWALLYAFEVPDVGPC